MQCPSPDLDQPHWSITLVNVGHLHIVHQFGIKFLEKCGAFGWELTYNSEHQPTQILAHQKLVNPYLPYRGNR